MDFKPMHLLAFGLLLVSVKYFLDHRKDGYKGPYSASGYPEVSPMKHDLYKTAFTIGFPALIYGLGQGQKLFDTKDFFGSFVGNIVVNVAAFFVFYEVVEPFVLRKLPYM